MKILTNHRYALITGIVLALVLSYCLHRALRAGFRIQPPVARPAGCTSWPACSGSACSTTSTPCRSRRSRTPPPTRAVPAAPASRKYVAPRALFWFRWAALVTWLAGAWLLDDTPVQRVHASAHLTVGSRLPDRRHRHRRLARHHHAVSTSGASSGRTRRRFSASIPATDEEKVKARKVALYASRTNFILSFPMLLCMAATCTACRSDRQV